MTWRQDTRTTEVLRGRGLRFVLLEQIRRQQTMTVAEMVDMLVGLGYELPGRPSKVVSDALRWEVARGRVVRLGRGVYGYGRVPRSTARRVRIFARRCNAWIVALMRGETPPPTPPTRPDRWGHRVFTTEDPSRPPWQDYGWLWTT